MELLVQKIYAFICNRKVPNCPQKSLCRCAHPPVLLRTICCSVLVTIILYATMNHLLCSQFLVRRVHEHFLISSLAICIPSPVHRMLTSPVHRMLTSFVTGEGLFFPVDYWELFISVGDSWCVLYIFSFNQSFF